MNIYYLQSCFILWWLKLSCEQRLRFKPKSQVKIFQGSIAGNFLASAMCAAYQLIVVGKGCVGYSLILLVLFSIWKGFIWPCFAGSVLDVERFYKTLFLQVLFLMFKGFIGPCFAGSVLDVERFIRPCFAGSVPDVERLYMTLFCRSCTRCGRYYMTWFAGPVLNEERKGIWPCFAVPFLDVERFYMTLFWRSMTLFFRSCSRCGKVEYNNCVCTGRVPDPTSLFLPTSFCM